jgi:hypothetical protein
MASNAAPIIEQSRAEDKRWWEFWK